MHTNTRSTAPSSALGAELQSIAQRLRAVVAGVRPEDVPACWAPEVLERFVELERLSVAGKVLIAAKAAAAVDLSDTTHTSKAEWLAAQQGTTTGRARADLATSGRLDKLPYTADEVRAGNLSAEQADAVTDAAVINPACERDLVDVAKRDSLRHTREEAERRKAEVRTEDDKRRREERVRRERQARIYTKHGEGRMWMTGPMSILAEIEQRLTERVGRLLRERRGTESEDTVDNLRFDALVDLIRNSDGTGRASESETVNGTRTGSGTPRRVRAHRLGLVKVDLSSLQRGTVGPGEVCEIPGFGTVSVDAARELLGDSVLALILTDGEAVAGVVNLARRMTVAQELAVLWQSPKCCIEGCDRTKHLEFDHRDDYHRTKVTTADGMERPCSHHHLMKTVEGWDYVAGTGRRRMVPPDHPDHPNNRPAPPGNEPPAPPVDLKIVGTPPTPRPAKPSVPPELLQRARRAQERARRRTPPTTPPAQGGLFEAS